MPDWLNNPEASYVLAAYSIAAGALLGLLIVSRLAARKRSAEWSAIRQKRQANDHTKP
jgi:hypothetical protein